MSVYRNRAARPYWPSVVPQLTTIIFGGRPPYKRNAVVCYFTQGLAISNCDKIRSVHNGFSRPESFLSDGEGEGGEQGDAFHFVAYVPHGGKVRTL